MLHPLSRPWLVLVALLLVVSCREKDPEADQGTPPPPDDLGQNADGHKNGCAATDPRATPVVVGVQPDESEQAYVDIINKATKSLRVYCYLMGTGGILDGLKAKAGQGVSVKVIFDVGNDANKTYYTQLKNAGAQVLWSDTKFTHMHAKTIIADEATALISTGNYALSYIKKERNFTARLTEPEDVAKLVELFDNDWTRKGTDLTCTRLLISPINSRPRLLALIDSAKSTLVVHSMQFADTDVRKAVANRKKAGVDVRVLVADPAWVDTNNEAAAFLKAEGIPIRYLVAPAVHTKDIVVDGKTAYLGSINLSMTSISQNREVGLIFSDASEVSKLTGAFEKDWATASSF